MNTPNHAIAAVLVITAGMAFGTFAHSGGHDGGGQHARAERGVDHRHDHQARRFDRRLARQYHRIGEGKRRGELSPHELKRLRREHHRLRQLERRYSADGHFSRPERHRLQHLLNEASRHIYRYRDNRRRLHGHRYVPKGEHFGLWFDGARFSWNEPGGHRHDD